MAGSHQTHDEQAHGGAERHADRARAEIEARQSVTGPVIGATFALCAFSVAVVAGLFTGNSATSVVGRALLAMIVCYPIGLVAGYICQHVLREHLRVHAEANPVPDLTEQHDESNVAPEQLTSVDEHEQPLVV